METRYCQSPPLILKVILGHANNEIEEKLKMYDGIKNKETKGKI